MSKKVLFPIIVIIVLVTLMLSSCSQTPDFAVEGSPVIESVSIEAGEKLPDVTAFVKDGYEGEIVTDMSEISSEPGVYPVEVKVDGKTYVSFLIIEDTIAPVGTVQPLQVKPGTEVSPEDFFMSVDDVSEVSAVYLSDEPDTSSPCAVDVALALVDSSFNETDYTSRLIVSELEPLTLEARAEALDVSEITDKTGATLTDPDFIPDTAGTYEIGVNLNGTENITVLTVVDTTPPSADPVEASLYTKHDILPETLVENATDFSEITYSYKNQPDFNSEGTQDVTVVLTDASGNSSEVNSVLTLVNDTEAPVLYGINDVLYLPQGGTISYFKDVYAEDNADSGDDITIDVDKSNVDIYTLGDYEITYTATDISGNSSTKNTIVRVTEPSEVTQEMLDEAIADTLAQITTDDMTLGEKAFAIYNYVREKVVYNGDSNKEDYIGEAYRGLTEFKGDCYTFYATTDALLKAIGAETMMVSREYNATRPTHHYWVKCNLGTGWYHIDTTNTGPRNFEAFMRTDDEFTNRAHTYWMFDRSKYPASPTTPYVKDWLQGDSAETQTEEAAEQ